MLRRFFPTLLIAVSLCCPAWADEPPPKEAKPAPLITFNFDRDSPGQVPAHFTPVVAGKGSTIKWEVRRDPHAASMPNILVQSGKPEPGENFALLLLDTSTADHGEIAVRFKTLTSDENQAVGIVYRYQDPKNYYVISASAGEEACALFRIKNGQRKVIDSKDVIVSPYTWHELRLTYSGKTYTALVDGELVLGGKDSGLLGAGLVGLWTDSGVAFDDFRIAQ